jgi:hypothetical protein
MEIRGLPERFWVVTRPSPVSELGDICFSCTYGELLLQARGGLEADMIVGIYADETEARNEAARLLGAQIVRTQDAAFMEVAVAVKVMAVPNDEEMTAGELAEAAVEAVANAVREGEKKGFRHRLVGQVSMGAGTIELQNQLVVRSSQDVSGEE